MPYMPRVADAELRERIASAGAVLIEGAKACGKTETALQIARSVVRLDIDQSARLAAQTAPGLLLAGEVPRLIDEWQVVPETWNLIRHEVDTRQRTGQFVLTGSATPADDPLRHTGAGRFSILRMRPMSLFESGHSTAKISLRDLLDGSTPNATDTKMTVERLAERITVGGWPAYQDLAVIEAARANRDYLQQIRDVDIPRVDSSHRDRVRVKALMGSLARNVSTEASMRSLAADAGVDGTPMDRRTVDAYLETLERLMVIEDQPAWAPHLRSKARLRNAPKRHYVDPSLAVAALGAGPDMLLRDLNALGLLFESLVIRDLRVYAAPNDGSVLHHRDSNGVEVDAIVTLADGRWGAFEIKLGAGLIEDGAAGLHRFTASIDTTKSGEPAVLGVITGTGYGYRRPDGICVIPIAALSP